MISAHRCGAGDDVELENTSLALDRAITSDVDYVEFDVQRCGDGTFVLYHDDHITIDDGTSVRLGDMSFEQFVTHADHFLDYEGVLNALQGKKKAHIDFKFTSPAHLYSRPETTEEVRAVKLAIRILGVDNIIVTSLEDSSVRAVRSWSRSAYPELLVGLSLGRDLGDSSTFSKIRTRLSEFFPARRYRDCEANLVVVNKQLARLSVARWANTKKLPMLVWTVDDQQELSYWLSHDRAWLVTTNHPGRALDIVAKLGR